MDLSKSAHCGQRWLCHNPSFKAMSWFPALQTLFLLYATSKIATTVATNGLRGIHHIVSGHGCIRSGNGRVPQLNPSSGPAILRLSVAGSPVVWLKMTELRHFFFSFWVTLIHNWLVSQDHLILTEKKIAIFKKFSVLDTESDSKNASSHFQSLWLSPFFLLYMVCGVVRVRVFRTTRTWYCTKYSSTEYRTKQ